MMNAISGVGVSVIMCSLCCGICCAVQSYYVPDGNADTPEEQKKTNLVSGITLVLCVLITLGIVLLSPGTM